MFAKAVEIIIPLLVTALLIMNIRHLTIKSWQDFLDSLSTTGGTILILLLLFCGMTPLLIHVLLMPEGTENQQVTTIIVSTYTGIFSALMIGLKGNTSRQQMVDRAMPPVVPPAAEPPVVTAVPGAPPSSPLAAAITDLAAAGPKP